MKLIGRPIFRGWHLGTKGPRALGTVPRAPRPKGAPRYGDDCHKRPCFNRLIISLVLTDVHRLMNELLSQLELKKPFKNLLGEGQR